tara:strand:+ start:5175 stop:6515 length:1341 start_codon:yes stop_codon:yes gene_type:complete
MNSQNPIVSVSNLYKRYDSTYKSKPINLAIKNILNLKRRSLTKTNFENLSEFALKNINLEVFPGQIIGLIGRNGSGKSTFLKLLAGLISPTSGKISIKCSVSSILELGIGFNNELTGEENAYRFGRYNLLSRSHARKNIEFIKNFAELDDFFYKPVKYYSSGMFARLAFASAISLKADLLIIDEILSVGDVIFQQKCFDYLNSNFLKNPNRSVIYVGHNINTCSQLCTHGIVLEKGLGIFNGEIKDAVDKYQSLITKIKNEKNSNLIKSIKAVNTLSNSNKTTNENLNDEWIDLFSSRFFNPKFNRIGERKFANIKSISVKGTPEKLNFEGNEFLEFNILVESKRQFSPSIGFGIWSLDGVHICGTNTTLSNILLKDVGPGETRKYNIKTKLNLNSGTFFVNFGLDYKIADKLYFDDILKSLMIIQVNAGDKFVGFTRSEILIAEN